MDFDWLWERSFLNWFAICLAATVGLLAVWLKVTGSRWLTPILYGLGAFVAALMASILIQIHFSQRSAASREPNIVEARLKNWADQKKLQYKIHPPDANSFFRLVFEPSPTIFVTATLPKRNPQGALMFKSTIKLSEDRLREIAALPNNKQKLLIARLKMNLITFGANYSMIEPLKVIDLSKSTPLDSMDQTEFLLNLDFAVRNIRFVFEYLTAFLAEHS